MFSISVIIAFAKKFKQEKLINQKIVTPAENDGDNVQDISDNTETAGVKYPNGISILEALSATGLRSVRYAKEIPGVKEITANDISLKAVEAIKQNIVLNGVDNLVVPSQKDAT